MTAPSPLQAPTGEIGRPGNMRPTYNHNPLVGPGGSSFEPVSSDFNPDLRFPRSVRVYNQMRTDDQVAGLIRACTLPIIEAGWDLDTTGCSPKVEQLVRAELGLPDKGEPMKARRRGQAGIVWQEHLREALGCLIYGFMPFEQVYSVTLPGEPGHPDGFENQPVVHLKKLAQRLPSTIRRIDVASDGGLVGIRQAASATIWTGYGADNPGDGTGTGYLTSYSIDDVFIDVDRLVFYCIDKEGADWTGQSILRTAYRPWFLKDVLIRVDAQSAERNGMGVPVVTYTKGGELTAEAALDIARNARAGATGGIALPSDATFQLVGLTGSTVDITAKIQMHDQAITKACLAMFMDLGHDRGAYNLGSLFVDMFDRSLTAIARGIANTTTEHVVRDLVEWNFGPDEPYPTVVPGVISAESALTPTDMKALADANLLTPDDKLEAAARSRWNLPEIDVASRPAPPPVNPFGPPQTPGAPLTAVPAVPAVPVAASQGDAVDDEIVHEGNRLYQRLKALRRART